MFARKHLLRWLTTPYRQPDLREVEKCSGATRTKSRPYQGYAGSFAAPPIHCRCTYGMGYTSRFLDKRFREACAAFILGVAYVPARRIPLNGRWIRHTA